MEEDYQEGEAEPYSFSRDDEDTESSSDSSFTSDTSFTPDSSYASSETPAESDTPLTDSLREQMSTPEPISSLEPTSTPILATSPELSEIDRELEELLKKQSSKVKVFGIGGGGGNTVSRMKEIGIKGGQFITVNTDAQDLLYSNADFKILIGRELTKGLGAGSDPKIGEEAAHESEQDLKKSMAGADMVFITCGLGGGTGTGAAPIIAALSKKQGAEYEKLFYMYDRFWQRRKSIRTVDYPKNKTDR